MFTLYIILLSACFVIFVVNSKKIPFYLTPLGWLVGYVLIAELFSYFLKQKQVNTNPVHHLYQLVELWALSLTYHLYYKARGKASIAKLIMTGCLVLTVLYTFVSFYVEGIYNDCIINFLVTSLIMILLSAYFFYTLYFENTEINILSFGFFWINAGNLIYASGTFFQMGFYTYLKSINPELANDLNIINHVLNYFLYGNYVAAFLCTKKYLY